MEILMPILAAQAVQIIAFIFGYLKFNKIQDLKAIEVKAEARHETAQARDLETGSLQTMLANYNALFNTLLERDKQTVQQNQQLVEIKGLYDGLKIELTELSEQLAVEKTRSTTLREKVEILSKRLDEQTRLRLKTQDERDELLKKLDTIQQSEILKGKAHGAIITHSGSIDPDVSGTDKGDIEIAKDS